MADSTTFSPHQRAIAAEAAELHDLARRLADHAPGLSEPLARLEAALDKSLVHAAHPLAAEQAAETFARRLRRVWLEAAGAEAGAVYRSPTASEARRLARHHDAFGYERDLQPESLEARCAAFFPAPPAGWRGDHLLFSSGQAAMTSALLGLGAHLLGDRADGPLRLAHRGAYFETRALLRLMPFLHDATFAQTADIVLDEPVCCDGRFHQIDTGKLLAASPRAVIFDTTLLGRADGVDRYLAALDPARAPLVLRVASCLKLFEAGLELANAGVLSVYVRGASDLAPELRRIRTLTGSGLALVDAIALEAPWFLDARAADVYAAEVFAHNARLAHAVSHAISSGAARFAPVSHPSLSGGAAPYCVFQLAQPSPDAYDALEREIAEEAARRDLLLAHGGSFGFRGHRFEVVKPETGEPPFLRVAMGRRGGWSCEGIIAMMGDIARG